MWALALAATMASAAAAPASGSTEVERWGQWEASWSAPVGRGNPFEVEMFVDLTAEGAASSAGETVRVRGFVDSQDGGLWRARYMPPTLGKWSYTTRCATVPELNGHAGDFIVVPPKIGTQDRGP